MIIKSPNVEPPKDVEDVEQTSYHDKNLMVSVDKSNDQVWINTHGTFWKGSFADLLEFLQSSAVLCETKAGCGCDNISD